MKTISFLVAWSALVAGTGAGCTSLHKTAAVSPARVQPPPPAAAPVSGTDLDQTNVANVRVGETLKAYPVGRYVDPNDPNVMHEAHVVYRRETGGAWNLNPNAPTVVPLGPVLAVADPAREPNPLPAELEEKMAQQDQLVASLIEQNEALAAQLSKLTKEIAEIRGGSSKRGAEGGKDHGSK